jgi:hypothetical protein
MWWRIGRPPVTWVSSTKRGPKVLSGHGKSAVLGAEYVYCFRAVGRNADLYTRSEIPVPVPSDAEWNDQPLEFDVLQHHVQALDQILRNMADIDDMTDELDEAVKKAGGDDYPCKGRTAGTGHLAGRIPSPIGWHVLHLLGLACVRVHIDGRKSWIRRVSASKRVDKGHVGDAHFPSCSTKRTRPDGRREAPDLSGILIGQP